MSQNDGHQSNIGQEATEKRRKVSRACTHCQKAHLTCDDVRPCQRCLKRGLGSTCSDAQRKKAKYLQDISSSLSASSSFAFQPALDVQTPSLGESGTSSTVNGGLVFDPSQFINFSLADLGFGSETTGLEYGFLGNMLDNPLGNELLMSASPATNASSDLAIPPSFSPGQILTPVQQSASPSDGSVSQSPVYALQYAANPSTVLPYATQMGSPIFHKPSGTVLSPTSRRKSGTTPEEAYTNVRKPFNYAEGFHYLIQYVKAKMGREDLTRISRALALFRPSFLALIMNLTEQDLVVMEKCIQRTLLEYEKLISFSGTPTVLWRRTGEVCLVGKEFSLLTQWSRDALLKKKMCIYELMDNRSAVEYWEKFSTHAFDNADSSCIYSCILHTPQQKPVPCTFCFTIKRDIFDLPSVIVGNFLPILS